MAAQKFSSPVAEFLDSIGEWASDANTDYQTFYLQIPVSSPAVPHVKRLAISCKHYKQHNPRGCMIVFQGVGSCASLAASVANMFRKAPHFLDVIAFDQMGHGLSQGLVHNQRVSETGQSNLQPPDCFLPDYQLLVQIGWQVVQTIVGDREKERLQSLPLFLYGKSLGGGTICHMLMKQAQQKEAFATKIRGVILEAPYVDLVAKPPSIMQYALSGISWLLPNTLVTKAEFDSLSRIPEQVQLRANHKECYLEGFSSTTALELLKFSNDLVAQLDSGQKHNACAILILHGTNDATTSIDGASKFLQWSTNSDKELKLYKDGRHNLTMDLCAKEVFDYCSQWIEKHLP